MEKLLWNLFLPGLGQLLTHQYVKGTLFLLLGILINVKANLNKVLMLSVLGKTSEAVQQTNYGWLLLYPCLYFFAFWDTCKDSSFGKKPFAFIPFVFSAYGMTVGAILSAKLTLFGYLIGPIWSPILFIIPGAVFGLLIQFLIIRFRTV